MINTHCTQSSSTTSATPGASPSRHRNLRRLGTAALGCVALLGFVGFGPAKPVAADDGVVTLTYTGASQTVTVPDGVLGAYVIVDGAAGGDGYGGTAEWYSPNPGGSGARVMGNIALTPGSTITVDVGGKPASSVTSSQPNPTPGWGGQAPGGTSYGNGSTVGGAGGGASSIRISDGTYAIVAGGGGGGGGVGLMNGVDKGGQGGTGGANGTGSNGSNGKEAGHGDGGQWGGQPGMPGGPGGPEHHGAGPGGGGGGGWRGGNGGGGGSTGGGGGGGGGAGSSYVGPMGIDGVITTAPSSANGQVSLTWIRSAICWHEVTDNVDATSPTQLQLPCAMQGVPGASIEFGPGQHGGLSVVDVASGVIEYTPLQPGWTGTDTFNYTLTNTNGEPTGGTIKVNVQVNAVQTSVGASQASPGDQVDVQASGLQPGENVQVNLHSTPVLLTKAQADSNGTVHVTVNLPDEAELGQHHIEILGEHSGSHQTPISLIAPAPASNSSSSTPWGVIAIAVLGAAVVGATGVWMARRRGAHRQGASTI